MAVLIRMIIAYTYVKDRARRPAGPGFKVVLRRHRRVPDPEVSARRQCYRGRGF